MNKINQSPREKMIGPIGMELAIEKIHLVQLEKDSSGKITFRAKISLPYSGNRDELLSSPKTIKKLIQQAFKAENFSGHNIVTVMPASDVRIISATYHVNNGQLEDDALLKIIEHRIQGDLADYVIDYLPVRGKKQGEEQLAVIAYAKRDRVIDYLESMRKAGLVVDEMEIGPSAIKRLIGNISTSEYSDNLLVINFGRTKSYMSLISGKRLLFDHEIEFGEDILFAHISISLDISLDAARKLIRKHGLCLKSEARNTTETDIDIPKSLNQILKPMFMRLASEINRALIYAASETRGESVRHVYLLGSIARWKGADRLLNQLVNIPVSIPNPIKFFGNADEIEKHQNAGQLSEIAVASGLALRGFGEQ